MSTEKTMTDNRVQVIGMVAAGVFLLLLIWAAFMRLTGDVYDPIAARTADLCVQRAFKVWEDGPRTQPFTHQSVWESCYAKALKKEH